MEMMDKVFLAMLLSLALGVFVFERKKNCASIPDVNVNEMPEPATDESPWWIANLPECRYDDARVRNTGVME